MRSSLAKFIGTSIVASLLCSCATDQLARRDGAVGIIRAENHDVIRRLEFRPTPEVTRLAAGARAFANQMYPKICAMLLDDSATPPAQFDLYLKPIKSQNTGEAHLAARRIYLNSDYLTNSPNLQERFDKVFVHEMAHMALQPQRWYKSFWRADPPAAGYWGESIADYAFYKLIGTNGWGCPECSARHPHYSSGYTCGGAFLLFVESAHGTNVVRQLIKDLSQHNYSDEFFVRATGKSLDQLWAEFQTTPAFKPVAAESLRIQQALGFKNGRPPRNATARFVRYVEHSADDFTRQAAQSMLKGPNRSNNIWDLIAAYLYLTQPGGCAERAWMDLREKHGVPGIGKDEHGYLSAFIRSDEAGWENYPQSRTLEVQKRGDKSKSTYRYTMTRGSPDGEWKLTKAWRAGMDGRVLEEFAVP